MQVSGGNKADDCDPKQYNPSNTLPLHSLPHPEIKSQERKEVEVWTDCHKVPDIPLHDFTIKIILSFQKNEKKNHNVYSPVLNN